MSISVCGRVECQHLFWRAVCFSLWLRLSKGVLWEVLERFHLTGMYLDRGTGDRWT